VNNTIIHLVLKEPQHLKLEAELSKTNSYFYNEKFINDLRLRVNEKNFKDFKCSLDTLWEIKLWNLKFLKDMFSEDPEILKKVKGNKQDYEQELVTRVRQVTDKKHHQKMKTRNSKNLIVTQSSKTYQKVSTHSPFSSIDSKNIEFEIEDDNLKKIKPSFKKNGLIYNCRHPSYYDQSSVADVYVGKEKEELLRKYSAPEYRNCQLGCVEGIDVWKLNSQDLTIFQLYNLRCYSNHYLPAAV
jgi:hypothetical protein